MHVVTASDENYVPGVLALISSTSKHNPEARFSVLQSGWSLASQGRINMLKDRLGIEISCIEIGPENFSQFAITSEYVTKMTFARLLIPDIFPNDDRIIYMDSDMLTLGSLREVWEADLDDNYIGAVHDMIPPPIDLEAINMTSEDYFNAGFLVLNLEAWRRDGVAQSCIDALSSPDCPYFYEDQSALNDIARERVLYLDAGYNFYAPDIWEAKATIPPSSIRVIHYLSKKKPWFGHCALSEIWDYEAKRCPELSYLPQEKITLRKRLSKLNRKRIMFMKWIAGIRDGKYLQYRTNYRIIRNYQKIVQSF